MLKTNVSTDRYEDDGSPWLPTSSNADKPPASREDVEAVWRKYMRLTSPSAAVGPMAKFMEERGLDPAAADALVDATTGDRAFGWTVHDGRGCVIGFNAGAGIKARAVGRRPGESTYWRRVEPLDRAVQWSGVAVVRPEERRDQPANTVVVFESETDLWAFAQLAPHVDLAMMPAGARTWKEEWAAGLRSYERVLVATDNDSAGDEGARLVAHDLERAVRLRPPVGKDWCEALRHGVSPELVGRMVQHAAEAVPTRPDPLDPDHVVEVGREVAARVRQPLNSRATAAGVETRLPGVPRDLIVATLHDAHYPPPEVRVWYADEITALPEPDEEPMVFGGGQLLEGEILGLASPAGLGKSLLLMQMGLSLAYGMPWFLTEHVPILRPRRVLYVPGEGTGRSYEVRFKAMQAAVESDPCAHRDGCRRFMALGSPLDDPRRRNGGRGPGAGLGLKLDIEAHVERVLLPAIHEHRPDVVMLDPVRALHSRDENSSQDMEAFFYLVRERIIRACGVTVIMAHHLKKGSRYDRDAARGGSWQENVATSWVMYPHPEDPDQRNPMEIVLAATKTRDGAPIPSLVLTRDPATRQAKARPFDASDNARGRALEGLHELVKSRGDAVRIDEAAAELGVEGRTKVDALWNAAKADGRFDHLYVRGENGRGKARAVQLADDEGF
jgi:hypothetical protein